MSETSLSLNSHPEGNVGGPMLLGDPVPLPDRPQSTHISDHPKLAMSEETSAIARLEARIDELEREISRKHPRGRNRSCSTCPDPSDSGSDDGKENRLESPEEMKPMEEEKPSEDTADPRILYIESHWSSGKGCWVDEPGRPSPVRVPAAHDAEHGLIWKVKRFRRNRSQPDVKEATILNQDLKALLCDALRRYPGHWDEEMVFQSKPLPFAALVHNWEALHSLAEEHHDDEAARVARSDLRSLLNEVRRSEECESYFASLDQLQKDKVIPFKFLWAVFPPGVTVLAAPYGEQQAFVVTGCSYARPVGFGQVVRRVMREIDSDDDDDFHNWFIIYCWYYDFDGDEFRRIPLNITISEYPGKKKVTALPCFPLDYENKKTKKKITDRLVARGQKFRTYNIKEQTTTMFSHKGKAHQAVPRISELDSNQEIALFRRIQVYGGYLDDSKIYTRQTATVEINGRVIVDVRMGRKHGPTVFKLQFERPKSEWRGQECSCTKCQTNPDLMETFGTAYDKGSRDESGNWVEFDEKQCLLCSPLVLGYFLDMKTWIQMSVDNLHTISESLDHNAFQDLVLPDDSPDNPDEENTKFLIKSLVEHHMTAKGRKSPERTGALRDFVEGKGQGLVILLHGVSGTGKTLTVECVSKLTGKPLLKISVADIGVKPEYVEEKLSVYFDLASAWDAILLIDEADILLETRTRQEGNLDRNAMVSVFLKILEYYGGILLLTTNRVKTIDIAVESRINLAVEFSNMQPVEQQRLFKKFLDRLDTNDIEDKAEFERNIKYFKAQDFSGRDIRNLISSALAISKAKKEKLAWRHIEIVKRAKEASQKTFNEQRVGARMAHGQVW